MGAVVWKKTCCIATHNTAASVIEECILPQKYEVSIWDIQWRACAPSRSVQQEESVCLTCLHDYITVPPPLVQWYRSLHCVSALFVTVLSLASPRTLPLPRLLCFLTLHPSRLLLRALSILPAKPTIISYVGLSTYFQFHLELLNCTLLCPLWLCRRLWLYRWLSPSNLPFLFPHARAHSPTFTQTWLAILRHVLFFSASDTTRPTLDR